MNFIRAPTGGNHCNKLLSKAQKQQKFKKGDAGIAVWQAGAKDKTCLLFNLGFA